MTPELFLAQIQLDVLELMRLSQKNKWLDPYGEPKRAADDLGYPIHAHLAARFGELAPQPFRPMRALSTASRPGSGSNRHLTVLGYCRVDAHRLRKAEDEFALPDAHQLGRSGVLATKPMPDSLFTSGRRLGFELRACPIMRFFRKTTVDWVKGPKTFPKGRELDVFLHRHKVQGEEVDRATTYRDWLADRLGEAAQLEECHLHAFRRVRVLRRTQAGANERKPSVSERPDALLRGNLRITDVDLFRKAVSRGVGRHKAFGFGMLLLRPPS
ncbi:MAG: type I-E CRISPR-associated protein Cas6/Cse3/CasE [Acidobacteriota bacterium]